MAMRETPLLSVIIPVYNAERYLSRCLDSVLAQTYDRLEILLVDDGSVDGSGCICDRYAGADSRVTAIHTANAGAFAARNLALDRASGDYIGFVDADDRLEPEMYGMLMSLALTHDADIAQCEMANDGAYQQLRGQQLGGDRVYEREELTAAFFREELTHGLLNKVFRRSCWEGLRFPALGYHEDAAVLAGLKGFCRRAVRTDRALYLYNTTNPSITRGKKKRLHIESMERLFAAFDKAAPDGAPYGSCFLCSEIPSGGRLILPGAEISPACAVRHIRFMHGIFLRHWEAACQTEHFRNAPGAKKLLRRIYRHLPVTASLLVWGYGTLTGLRSRARGVVR